MDKARRFSTLSGLLTMIVSVIVIASWAMNSSILEKLRPGATAMNPWSAIAFGLAGLAVWLLARPQATSTVKLFTRILAAALLTIGLIRVVGLFGLDLKLDQTLFLEELGTNRMAPNAALCFFLLGSGLLFFEKKPVRLKFTLSENCAIGVLLITVLALTGYLMGTLGTYGFLDYTPMAAHTAATLFLITLGFLFVDPDSPLMAVITSPELGGIMARKRLPVMILLPIALGWLRVLGERAGLFSTALGVSFIIVGMVVSLAAVTWRCSRILNKASLEIKNQNATLHLILKSIGDGVVVGDETGKVTLFNPAADEMIGVAMSLQNPERWREVYQPRKSDGKEHLSLEELFVSSVVKEGKIEERENYFKNSFCPQGRYFSQHGNPLRDPTGKIIGIVSVFRDITPQKIAEKSLRSDKIELERQVTERREELKNTEFQLRQFQKMDAIGTLAGGVAHDFNNILGAIQMYCDVLADRADSPESVRETAEDVRKVGTRGASLTRQLLIFSRKQIMQTKTLDVNELIDVLLKMLRRLIGENISITTKLSPDLWKIKADPSQIEQVILNLVVNARDAMPTGGKITVETENQNLTEAFTTTHLTVHPGPHIALTVTDTGSGMERATLDRLFEPFFTTKPIGKGTGLGLSTAYGIVKQSKGSIWVYSEVGHGSVFKIYFPASVSEEDTAPVKDVTIPSVEKRGSETILLVEDDEDLRELFTGALQKHGFKVLAAANGVQALRILENDAEIIHLLLTDIIMPEMGGLELSKAVQNKRPDLRILFMSGYAQDAKDKLLGAGGAWLNFIQKPFNSVALVSRIKEILERDKR